jgi:N-acetylmuramoyl-L-alanine amidase
VKKVLLLILVIVLITPFIIFTNKNIPTSVFMSNVIFIDPGHGGKDNGTSYENIVEDELNLKIASYLYEMILKDGGIAYLTRNSDYDLSSMYAKNHKVEDLNKRIKYIDSFNSSLFVSIHLNYYPNNNVNGLQVFYQKHNERSLLLAKILQSTLNQENKKKKEIKKGDYYLLNNTSTPGVIIECGFLSSEYDRKRLLDDRYLMKIAKLIKEGINEYLLMF